MPFQFETICDIIVDQANTRPDEIAFTFVHDGELKEEHCTYSQILQHSMAIAAKLKAMGAKGERALLLYPSGLDFIYAFFGCLFSGVIAVPVYPPRKNNSLDRLLSISRGADAMFALATSSVIKSFADNFPDESVLSKLQWMATDGIDEVSGIYRRTDVSASDIALLQFTSGSTGNPKGTMVTHNNILTNCDFLKSTLGTDRETIAVSWLPSFHDMGLIDGIIHPLFAGFRSVNMPPAAFLQKPARWLSTISRYKATHSGGPNFAYEYCIRKVQKDTLASLDLSSWRTAYTSAEPIREVTISKFTEKFSICGFKRSKFLSCYGLAEATLLVSAISADEEPYALTADSEALSKGFVKEAESQQKNRVSLITVGRPIGDTEIIIVDPDTKTICPSSTLGEIWINGNTVAQGYWNHPTESDLIFNARVEGRAKRYLRTGDIGFFHKEKLYISGRLKDVLIIRGQNYFPQDIEDTVEQACNVINAQCTGVFSIEKNDEERVVIVAELNRHNLHQNYEDVFKAIREAVSYHCQLSVHAICLIKTGTIPKTSSGKIQRHATKQKFLAKELIVISQWEAQADGGVIDLRDIHNKNILGWLTAYIADRLKTSANGVSPDDSFQGLGLDSVASVEMCALLSKHLAREISPTWIYDYPSIGKFAARVSLTSETEERSALVQNAFSKDTIAVVGMACKFPGADDLASFWELLANGKSAISDTLRKRWKGLGIETLLQNDPQLTPIKNAGLINDPYGFDAHFFGVSTEEAYRMDPQQRLLLQTVWHAFEHTGLPPESLRNDPVGVFIGVSNSDYMNDQFASLNDLSPYSGTGNALSILANRISYYFDFTGPSIAIDTACSSSLVAIHQACQSLLSGDVNVAVAGGSNLILSPHLSIVFAKAGMLSPEGKCKTFDNKADGYVRGEGCGVVILKRYSDALANNDNILAVIAGCAVNQDGKSNGLTAPNGLAQERVIRQALTKANIDPKQVSYIEAHGTGTKLGDPIEVNTLSRIFRDSHKKENVCRIGSVKTNIGHLEAASGIAGLIKVILSINRGQIAPSINFDTLNSEIKGTEALDVASFRSEWNTPEKIAGVSSFGFGGTNAHVVVKESALTRAGNKSDEPFSILTISAKTKEALSQLTLEHARNLDALSSATALQNYVYTSACGRNHFSHRLSLVASTGNEMSLLLREFAGGKVQNALSVSSLPAYDKPAIGFVFTGQGSEYLNMGKQLFHHNAVFREEMERCDFLLRPLLGESILDIIWNGTEGRIHETILTQPALFSIEYALAKVWTSWGIKPDFVMGHSLGEIVAACISGVFSFEDGLTIAAHRGRIMQEAKGIMVSVFTSVDIASLYIKQYSDRVAIAAINGVNHTVLSGDPTVMEIVLEKLRNDKIHFRVLPAKQGFHSPLIKNIIADFESVFKSIQFHPPAIPIISTTPAAENSVSTAAYWIEQALSPVDFLGGVRTATNYQRLIMLEIGPKPILTAMGEEITRHSFPQVAWVPSLKEGENDVLSILQSLSNLYVKGVDVNWNSFYRSKDLAKIQIPLYPFAKTQFRYEVSKNAPHISNGLTIKAPGHSSQKNASIYTDDILATLTKIVSDELGIDGTLVDKSVPLVEMGADSIILMRFIKKVEQQFQVRVNISQLFSGYNTLAALANHLKEHLPFAGAAEWDLENQEYTHDRQVSITNDAQEAQLEHHISLLDSNVKRQIGILESAKFVLDKLKTSKAHSRGRYSQEIIRYQPVKLEEDRSLTFLQQKFITDLIARYTLKTNASKEFAAMHRKGLSDWINSIDFRLILKELTYPIVSRGSSGAHFWDIDGNEYLDLAIGYGVNFFGNGPSFVKDAIEKQLNKGFELATQSVLAGEVANLISQLTGSERVTFCNTGTDAVMASLRIARAVTGRNKVVLFNGYYHGTFDGNLAQQAPDDGGNSFPITAGTPYGMVEDIIVLQYGSEESLTVIQQRKAEIGAVLVEPVQSRRPGHFPIEFLQKLRTVTTESHVALIFDEIITGFRIHPGGVQSLIGIQADITLYGKIVGGGMPIGIVAGKAIFMDAIDGGNWSFGDSSYPSKAMIFFGGTFCKHPLSLSAAKAVLDKIKNDGIEPYNQLNEKVNAFASSVNNFFSSENIPFRVANFGSLFRIESFGRYNPLAQPLEVELFFRSLIEKGIFTWERRVCFFSMAHSHSDFERVESAIRAVTGEMKDVGFFNDVPYTSVPLDRRRSQENEVVRVPLTDAQKQLFILSQIDERGNTAYNITTTIRLTGALNIDALHQAIRICVNNHQALRTTISENCDVQLIHPRMEIPLEFVDLSLRSEVQRVEAMESWRVEESKRPFALTSGPLARIYLLKVSADVNLLVFTVHHIVCDGWSVGIVLQEISQRYNELLRKDGEAIHRPSAQFADYINWFENFKTSVTYQHQRKFWMDKLATEIPVVVFPVHNIIATETMAYEGARILQTIGPAIVSQLRNQSKSAGVTYFTFLFSAFAVLIHRLTRQNKVVIGIPSGGRQGNYQEVVGFLARVLPIVIDIEKSTPFGRIAKISQSALLQAFEHQHYSIAEFMAEPNRSTDAGKPSFVNVVFNLDIQPSNVVFKDLKSELIPSAIAYTTHDLSIDAIEINGELRITMDYNSDLFSPTAARAILDGYAVILEKVATSLNDDISHIPIMSDADRYLLLHTYNNTSSHFDVKPIHVLFEENATRFANKVAVIHNETKFSYRDVNNEANRIAGVFRGLALNSNMYAGILIDRSVTVMISMLGILKAGGAYIPFDKKNPAARLTQQINTSGTRYLVTTYSALIQDEHFFSSLQSIKYYICLDVTDSSREAYELLYGAKIIECRLFDGQHFEDLSNINSTDDACYLLFTSGSTGEPKGALLQHAGVVNHILAGFASLSLDKDFRFLQSARMSSDISVWQFLAPVLRGGAVVIIDDEDLLDYSRLIDILRNEKVTIAEFVPSFIAELLHYISNHPSTNHELPSLKWIMSTGEQANAFAIRKWLSLFPSTKVVNAYGPCETSDDVSQFIIDEEVAKTLKSPVPVGEPIANMNLFVLDEHLQPAPRGFVAEIYISGVGVGLGYLNDPLKTKECFINNPFPGTLGTTLYKTGDYGLWDQYGNLVFVGRIDNQVKLRGFRIELGEIESSIMTHPDPVAAAVVLSGKAGEEELIAYVALSDPFIQKKKNVSQNIKQHLINKLPRYMVPSAIYILEKLPLTNTGKIDRLQLAALKYVAVKRPSRSPRTSVERALHSIWCAVMGRESIDIDADFLDMGGHSLKAAQIAYRIHEQERVKISLRDFFENGTIEKLARLVSKTTNKNYPSLIPKVGVREFYVVSPVQQRLWILSQVANQNNAYNVFGAFYLHGEFDVTLLEKAFHAIVQRHEILRTNFVQHQGKVWQKVKDSVELKIEFENNPNITQHECDAIIYEECHAPFILETDELIRIKIIALTERKVLFLISMHHIISDGVSLDILQREISHVYNGFTGRGPISLPPLARQYKDFAAWHTHLGETDEYKKSISYWLKKMQFPIPILQLPTDFSRPKIKTFSGKRIKFSLDHLSVAISDQATKMHASVYSILMSSVRILLHKYTGQSDLIIGTPSFGREQCELENLIGCFINTLALRQTVDTDDSFDDHVVKERETIYSAFEYQQYPFDALLQDLKLTVDQSRSPLFDVFVTVDTEQSLLSLHGVVCEPIAVAEDFSQFDLAFDFEHYTDGTLSCTLEFNTDLFFESTVHRMIEHYKTLLTALLAQPHVSLKEISMYTVLEMLLISRWGDALGINPLLLPYSANLASMASEQELEQISQALSDEFKMVLTSSDIQLNPTLKSQLNFIGNQKLLTIKSKPETSVSKQPRRSLKI